MESTGNKCDYFSCYHFINVIKLASSQTTKFEVYYISKVLACSCHSDNVISFSLSQEITLLRDYSTSVSK